MSTNAKSTRWVEVCPLDALPHDRGVCALVGTEQVAVFRVGDEVHAIANYDPFSRAFVMSRGIVGSRGGAPVVASPMYKQVFDLRTGRCVDEPGVRLRTYAVSIESGMVRVQSAPSHIPTFDVARRAESAAKLG